MRFLALLSVLLLPLVATAQDLPTIEAKTATAEQRDGFFPVYWDAANGKVWLEIPRWGEEDGPFIYVNSLPAGLGSNDIGLDRNQLGGERIAYFERIGDKVLLRQPNLRYRANTDNALERASVRDAFARSILHAFKAEAQTGDRVLVDATDFIVQDAHGVVQRLQQSGQGTFRFDRSRSVPHPEMTKAFPRNTELEAWVTFASDRPGGQVRSVAADPTAVTLRVRHSFVALPEAGFEPRRFDPRSGYYATTYYDYSAPIGEDMAQRFITRHRLEKQNPSAERSRAVEPIVYYLDNGTPEPVRTALLEGGRWWNQAFEAAGYIDAFRVEMLPDGADPMDVRYNMINWVHRSTRGWSYGSSVTDPRTGEIIKGHVLLGSLRVRQDYLLAEGLLAPYLAGDSEGMNPDDDPMLAMALARIRQLSAHEIGHTLGIAHNFAASGNDRASVMDYPAPLALLTADGEIDLSQAYDTGIGEWDKMAVRYGYTDFAPGTDETAALDAILVETREKGLAYITDSDARPVGGAHPTAHLWDNGASAITALQDEMAVRAVALDRFDEAVVQRGRPLATLEEVLVPLYLRHRYAVEAAVKLVGGVDYTYALRGDNQVPLSNVAGDVQRAAVDALLQTVTPDALRLPENAVALIPPRPPGYSGHRELFDRYTGVTFDPYAPAQTVAGLVFDLLLHPSRAARLVYQNDFMSALPSLRDVMSQVNAHVWSVQTEDDHEAELARLVQRAWVDALMDLADYTQNAPAVRAQTHGQLAAILDAIGQEPPPQTDAEAADHLGMLIADIARFLSRDYDAVPAQRDLTTPPGSPIGSGEARLLRRERRDAFLAEWDTRLRVCGVTDTR